MNITKLKICESAEFWREKRIAAQMRHVVVDLLAAVTEFFEEEGYVRHLTAEAMDSWARWFNVNDKSPYTASGISVYSMKQALFHMFHCFTLISSVY